MYIFAFKLKFSDIKLCHVASLHISPHLRIFASLQITFAYAAAEQNIKAKSPPQTQTRQQYDEEETDYKAPHKNLVGFYQKGFS